MQVLYFILLMLMPGFISAQQKHFLYIQGENQQAFYVKMEGTIFSSSASGFIIIPRLENGVVDMTIGFPRAQWPEHTFSIEIKSTDKGLVLKNQDKGWILQDLQTSQMITGVLVAAKKNDLAAEKKKTDDPFASSLADAISDPGIREVNLITTTTTVPKKPVTPAPTVVTTPPPVQQPVKDVAATKQIVPDIKPSPETPKAEVKSETPIIEKPFVSQVEKISESKSPERIGLVYLDKNGDQSDTVRAMIEIPVVKDTTIVSIVEDKKDTLVVAEKPLNALVVTETKPVVPVPAIASEVEVSANKETPVKKTEELKSVAKEVDYEKTAATVLPDRKDCKDIATEKDMISARKKAYTLGADAEVIRHYTKEVKSKCYTVGLLQSLSFAFVNDASRYQFFQEAYPWVMDPANYPQLERLFVSKEYVSKFKQLINAE